MLSVIAERNDILQQDARWLHRTGEHRWVRVGEEVIQPGVRPTHLFVVLEGEFEMLPPPEEERTARRLGPGALIGEMACVWCMAARCSVRAATNGTLLCIRPCDVDERMGQDPSFGARFPRLASELAREHHGDGQRRSGGLASRELEMPEVIEKLLRGDF